MEDNLIQNSKMNFTKIKAKLQISFSNEVMDKEKGFKFPHFS